jgi:hypothetical protein
MTEVKEGQALVHRETTALDIPQTFSLEPRNLSEAMEFSRLIAASELCPKDYRAKPANVLIAVQMAKELGISPMQGLQNISVINGRPTMWGDLLIGLVQASGKLEAIEERDPQEAFKVSEGRCAVKRVGVADPVVRTFTMEMATKAGLVQRSGADGPWSKYPGRMLQMRARSWALRDAFADVLKGLQSREEVEDYPTREPIAMPRRASEVNSGEVSRFIGDGQTPSPAQSGSTNEPPAARTIWRGVIASISEKNGETNGKKWKLYIVKGSDGTEFNTFDSKDADFARQTGPDPVAVVWETTKKGGKKIVGIELSTQREPGDEGPDA